MSHLEPAALIAVLDDLYWDSQGFCLYCKVLEKGRLSWASPADGTIWLTSAQLPMLGEGM